MAAEDRKGFFEDQGYLILEGFMSDNEVAECQAEIDRLHKVAASLKAKDDPRVRSFQWEPYSKKKEEGGLPVLRKIEQTRDFSDIFKRLAAHPALVETVQGLIGPDLLLFRSTLMLKPAFHGSAHAFHQDSAYWPMDPPVLVTVSIALTDATLENGCIQVIPESHKWGLQKWGHIARDQDESMTDRDDVDLSKAQKVPLKAGSALMFHSLAAHGSGPNNSSYARRTALYAYFPPSVRYAPSKAQEGERTFPVIAGMNGQEEATLVAETRAQGGI